MKTSNVVKTMVEFLVRVATYALIVSLIGSLLVGAIKLFVWILSL